MTHKQTDWQTDTSEKRDFRKLHFKELSVCIISTNIQV